ncbi:MAG: DNA gyrase subunit A [Candidatus Margulisbacteria bacterium]|nr:DNA gyrase subunit A [Candidatus Margulisiibacteriota bacterium]
MSDDLQENLFNLDPSDDDSTSGEKETIPATAETTSLPLDDQDPSTESIDIINIDDEMKSSYLEYAMSVIVGRALPDARDGLKPVHRRILYSMYDSGYTASKPYKKCARIVGDVLGRYHPHGDSAVYDSLVRMAQDFSMRYQLIDGQGNYGSIDGDNAAAMRYTEAKMARLSMELLHDIEKETVPFAANFDESLEEPTVLPTRLPMLLLNGTSGIAVGMATNIPPHNLTEVIHGVNYYIDHPDATIEDLMAHVKGPDFPTKGIICGEAGIISAYNTGRGIITLRSRTHVEENKKRKAIIVTEIPYQVNKANVIMKIAELVNDKKINGISDLRDESDRKGLRIYIELKRDAQEAIILNQLFKHTQLQTSFGINIVALVNGQPKTLNLKEVFYHYVTHRKEVIRKRTEYDLKIAKNRLHILEGLRIALQHIDAIIALIKQSNDSHVARQGLIDTYNLSEKQATAILEMRLQRLTGLEQEKIENEYNELVLKIADLEDILVNQQRVLNIIKDEHNELNDRFGDERRTEIGGSIDQVDIEDLIPKQTVAILRTKNGFIKRMPVSNFRSQLRGGRGVSGISTREEDIITQILVTNSHDFLLCFTSTGKVHKIKSYQIPESSRTSKGLSVNHLLELDEDEKITSIIQVNNFESDEYLMMCTKKGIIKKTELNSFSYFKTRAIRAISLDEDDELSWVLQSNGKKDIILATSDGMVIRFDEGQVRSMGRTSRGVRAIKIKPDDRLVSVSLIDPDTTKLFLLLLTTKGHGKNIRVDEFKVQNRGGIGVKALKFRKTVPGDKVTDAEVVEKDDEIIVATFNGTICRQKVANISIQRRTSQGVRIIKLDANDDVISMAKVIDIEDDEVQVTNDNKAIETTA